jgi:ABC-type Fe3+-siderophore transport system permease subunit
MTDDSPESPLDMREQLARIDHMLADHQRIFTDMRRIEADHDRKRQEIRYAPWVLVVPAILGALTAGAALFAAGAAFMKLFS